mmetsp:Transcript_3735/g.9012  ORF Transcript_3735/g.9012 Transcript_3735/m.9012 type:complete len:291 (+) Transcript_3735:3275-4147(+)
MAVTLSSARGMLELVSTVPDTSGSVRMELLLASATPSVIASPSSVKVPSKESGRDDPITAWISSEAGDSAWLTTPSCSFARTFVPQFRSKPPSSITITSSITLGSSPSTKVPETSGMKAILSSGIELVRRDVIAPTSVVGPPNVKYDELSSWELILSSESWSGTPKLTQPSISSSPAMPTLVKLPVLRLMSSKLPVVMIWPWASGKMTSCTSLSSIEGIMPCAAHLTIIAASTFSLRNRTSSSTRQLTCPCCSSDNSITSSPLWNSTSAMWQPELPAGPRYRRYLNSPLS